MKKALPYIVLFYSLLLILLGIKGYAKGSSASLYSGVGFGSLLLFSSIGLFLQKKFALYSATILTACLMLVFIIRCIKTGGGTIPGALAVLSAGVLCYIFLSRLSKD